MQYILTPADTHKMLAKNIATLTDCCVHSENLHNKKKTENFSVQQQQIKMPIL